VALRPRSGRACPPVRVVAAMHWRASRQPATARAVPVPGCHPKVDAPCGIWHHGQAMAVKLVIFDMDGTLLEPAFDFDAIRREIGLPPGAAIIEAMERFSESERARANWILERHEAEAARRSRLMPGAGELLDWLGARGVRTAVLTRNSRRSVDHACRRHGLAFDAVVTREDHLPKPSPVGIRRLMQTLGAEPDETVMVGDYSFDVEAGAAARCRTIALVSDPRPAWASEATWIAADLAEVRRILQAAADERGGD